MTDSEKRRSELLRQTRILYSEKKVPPAVHPRYQSFYTKLYTSEENSEEIKLHGTLGIRMFIAVLLFAFFVTVDYKGENAAPVDSKKIIQEIERNIDIKQWNLL